MATTRNHRRSVTVAAAIAVMALLAACQPSTPGQDAVLNAMNSSRTAHGRRALTIHGEAHRKAQAWAEHLARIGRLEHSRLSDGITSRWCNLGENVGYGGSVASVQNAYMNSPGHRANILDTKWNAVGTGHAKRGNTVYTVQVFIRTC